jgi:hypothetical protein
MTVVMEANIQQDFQIEANELNDDFLFDINLLIPHTYQEIVSGIEEHVNNCIDIELEVIRSVINYSISKLLTDYTHLFEIYEETHEETMHNIKQNIIKIVFIVWRISMIKMEMTNFCETYEYGIKMPRSLPLGVWQTQMNEVCVYNETLLQELYQDYSNDVEIEDLDEIGDAYEHMYEYIHEEEEDELFEDEFEDESEDEYELESEDETKHEDLVKRD